MSKFFLNVNDLKYEGLGWIGCNPPPAAISAHRSMALFIGNVFYLYQDETTYF